MEKPAALGGTPVRTQPFPPNMPGASLIGEEELAQLADVVREKSPFRHYGVGNPCKVDTFEQMAGEYFGRRFALAVSTGTAALSCAVAAAGLGPGDEVIIPGFSWYSDYSALVNAGITPVFAEIGEDLNLDPEDFAHKITPSTKAVIPVHYQGCPAQMEAIVEIARRHKLIVIEDCAQACGGEYRGAKLGTIGDLAIFSFQTHKMLTCGEGGLLLTDDEELFVRAVRYHDLGFVRDAFKKRLSRPELAEEEAMFAGLQLRMSELSGAFLLAQMGKLDFILETCRRWHDRLRGHMANRPGVQVRHEPGDCGISFIMLLRDAQTATRFQQYMQAEGIPCAFTSACCNLVHKYPIRSGQMAHPALPPFGPGFGGRQPLPELPRTDDIFGRCVAIGIGPTYTEQEICDIELALDKVYAALFGEEHNG